MYLGFVEVPDKIQRLSAEILGEYAKRSRSTSVSLARTITVFRLTCKAWQIMQVSAFSCEALNADTSMFPSEHLVSLLSANPPFVMMIFPLGD